jgi:type IV pilus assembly protein PilY1
LDPAHLRAGLKHVVLTQTGNNLSRTATCSGTTAACSASAGWYFDLTAPRERVNLDLELAMGTLVFQSNVPDNTPCAMGYNLFNYVDFRTGVSPVGDGGLVTSNGGDSLATGGSLVQGGGGTEILPCTVTQLVTNADGTTKLQCPPIGIDPPIGKRISWREIMQ